MVGGGWSNFGSDIKKNVDFLRQEEGQGNVLSRLSTAVFFVLFALDNVHTYEASVTFIHFVILTQAKHLCFNLFLKYVSNSLPTVDRMCENRAL